MITLCARLRECGLKATPQRIAIIDIVKKEGHITIERLYQILKNKHKNLSLSTIYKNILTLQERGLLKELKVPKEKNYYELKQDEHSHLVCNRCGMIEDIKFYEDEMMLDLKNIANEHQFKIEGISLFINGICKNCAKT